MHLLAAQAGAIQQDGEAIDLCQSPAPLIFASSADSELAMLAGAVDRAGGDDLRLANTLRLAHNLSVDLWVEETVRHARLVVVRLIGGPAYWLYGVDELTALALSGTIRLVLLPGDANPDPVLRDRSGIAPEDWDRLHALFIAGGPDNADTILAAFRLLAGAEKGEAALDKLAPAPFARFGLWWPGRGMVAAEVLAEALGTPHPPYRAPSPARGEGEPIGFSQDPSPLAGEGEPEGRMRGAAYAPILFYRSALEGAGTATIEALITALLAAGLSPVPMVISSLKEGACVRFVQAAMAEFPPAVILNLTGFSIGVDAIADKANPFAGVDAPVIQLVQSGRTEAQWQADSQGLNAKDLAMLVVLPEVDGRIGGLIVGHKVESLWHAATQCALSAYAPDASGVRRAARLAANWALLRATPRADRRIGLVLANYPLRDGRLANGVGYDAPQSTVEILRHLQEAGYSVADLPDGGNALIARLQAGPTNADPRRAPGGARLSLARYADLLADLPPSIAAKVGARWGAPEADPFVRDGAFHLPVVLFGNVAVLLQPARGYDRDDAANYHDPDLVPPHAYCAAYLWLREEFGAHALIHNGKHGNLEWLPGKAAALAETDYPDALWGQLPHLYPFIVNDPGEGTQAKRRTGAVIVDHLVPPLTRAETYGPLKDLEALLDEYYAASGMDRRRLAGLRKRILDFTRDSRLDRDIGLPEDETQALLKIDNFLCDLKEAQIRDGLHIFGKSPQGTMLRDLIVALARVPRGEGSGEASLIRALADDLKLGLDPLTAELGQPWRGPVPAELAQAIRTAGDIVEALEHLAARLVDGQAPDPDWTATAAVLDTVKTLIRPRLAASGPAEVRALLDGLDGKFVRPGPSGAPSRGRIDVLPTGRNFYSVDNRAVPTPTAWELGRKAAESLLVRHFQDHGTPLRSAALSVWGTANMRTGGDDLAQAMALIGVKPVWDPSSLRVSGYEIVPLAKLGRPRVDVTLRISGLFRDAFPAQVTLFDRAIRAVGALDEPEDQNPIAFRMRADARGLMADGQSEAEAALAAGHRIFGARPGAYGMGLSALVHSGQWRERAELGKAVLDWGHYAYGAAAAGLPAQARFSAQLGDIEAVLHNQDNREHDVLDSDEYWQFQGGLVAAAESLTGRKPAAYFGDTSRPERPQVRALDEEISRVMRARVVNPKWISAMQRHGYKGAFEIIATVDYMLAFAATAGAVQSHHFDLAFSAFVEDRAVRDFLMTNNRHGFAELLARFAEAARRGYWSPRSNSAHALIEELSHER